MILPEEFDCRMRRMLGEEYSAFRQCYEEAAVRMKGLRVNRLKGDAEDFRRRAPFELVPPSWARAGFLCPEEERPGRHPWHEAGAYYLQEPSAMVPASLLGAGPGERVLDLCAAPGGKTTQTASDMAGGGILLSNEIHPQRAAILSQNVERMGIRNCVVTNADPETLLDRFPHYFDRILVDAPCSGEGMFRKEEQAVSEWSPENVIRCAERQKKILDCADGMLREGGRLVYSTCTFAPEENEGSVGEFLLRHPDYAVEPVKECEGFSRGVPAWGSGRTEGLENTVRIWPHRSVGEGHFAAVLRKGDPDRVSGRDSGIRRGRTALPSGIRDRERRVLWESFCREVFRNPEEWTCGERLVCRGDILWLVPEDMPDTGRIRVLRQGLMLGEFRKNRFEPAHALAMALSPAEVNLSADFGAGTPEAAAFLHGDTIRPAPFHAQGRGWVLVSLDGWSAGWAKLAGGVLKNHYPRGLRTRC